MKLQEKKIEVPKFLNELFGRNTTLLHILAIFVGSISLTVLTILLFWDVDLSVTKKIVLTIIAVDIGGGFVANFTEGTNNYYAETSKKRYLFVFFHILQPLLLAWIYPIYLYVILIIALYTLISSLGILNIKEINNQIVIAAMLLLLGILLIQFLISSNQLLQLILLVFSVKLILAFAVNWTGLRK